MKDIESLLMDSWQPEFVVSSGSLNLDNSLALSNYKGIPSGSMVHIFSAHEGSFKTSLALASCADIQKVTGGKIGFVDAENALTGTNWLENMGLDLSKWKMASPETGEEALEIAKYFIEHPDYKGIVIDSIDACVPESIYVSDFGSSHIGNHAKLVTDAVRKFKALVRKHQKILFLINQMKVNVTSMGARGNKTTGGSGINFYSKLNMEIVKSKSQSQLMGEEYIPLTIKVQRSKFGTSHVEVETYARQGFGIDHLSELRDFAETAGLLVKKGSWWSFIKGEEVVKLGQGGQAPLEWCARNKDLLIKALKTGELDEDSFR